MTSLTRKLMAAVLAGGFALGSQLASGATADLRYQGGWFGYDSGTIYADFKPTQTGLESKGVYAGGFNMNVADARDSGFVNGQSILAWCVDVFHNLKTSGSFNYTVSGSPSLTNQGALQNLINQHYGDVKDRTTSAAFQLAVWEIVNEKSGVFDLASGDFKAAGFNQSRSGNWTAMALAADWLKLDDQAKGSYKVTYLYDAVVDANVSQNLIAISQVPLPGAAILMASALGLGGLISRRRKRT